MAWVTSDYAWHMIEAKGPLEKNGNQIRGVLHDKNNKSIRYEFIIKIDGNSAHGQFKVSPEEDEQFVTISGTYKFWRNAGGNGCVEQIQLINEVTYVGLFRDYKCKP